MDDCIMKTERGIDPSLDSSDDGAENTQDWEMSEEHADPGGAAMSYVVEPMATTSAWHRTWYEDPPGVDVNSAKAHVTWTYNGTCVTSSSNQYSDYTWFTATGWRKLASETKAAQNCQSARTASRSVFSNFPFCIAVYETKTSYLPNRIRGLANGSFAMNWKAKKVGDCSYLLTFHRSHS